MKALKLFTIATIMFFSTTLTAQASVNVNIGSPPLWGPYGYTDVRYYYLPDVEAYYDIETAMFIYFGGGVWIHRTYLPTRYRYYDLYSGYKVVMTDYHGHEPYIHFHNHKMKYAKGYKGGYQKTMGDKPGKGNNKSNSPSNNSPHKNSQQNNNTKNNGGGNDKGGSYGNHKKSGGNEQHKSGSQGGGKNNQKSNGGGGHGKKK